MITFTWERNDEETEAKVCGRYYTKRQTDALTVTRLLHGREMYQSRKRKYSLKMKKDEKGLVGKKQKRFTIRTPFPRPCKVRGHATPSYRGHRSFSF